MTAELAVTFPVVVLALAVVLLAGSLAQAGVSCVDGARAAARAVSRGDPHHVAVEQAHRVVDGAAVEIVEAGTGGSGQAASGGAGGTGLVAVRVSLAVAGSSGLAWGDGSWALPVTCQAHAWLEARP